MFYWKARTQTISHSYPLLYNTVMLNSILTKITFLPLYRLSYIYSRHLAACLLFQWYAFYKTFPASHHALSSFRGIRRNSTSYSKFPHADRSLALHQSRKHRSSSSSRRNLHPWSLATDHYYSPGWRQPISHSYPVLSLECSCFSWHLLYWPRPSNTFPAKTLCVRFSSYYWFRTILPSAYTCQIQFTLTWFYFFSLAVSASCTARNIQGVAKK